MTYELRLAFDLLAGRRTLEGCVCVCNRILASERFANQRHILNTLHGVYAQKKREENRHRSMAQCALSV